MAEISEEMVSHLLALLAFGDRWDQETADKLRRRLEEGDPGLTRQQLLQTVADQISVHWKQRDLEKEIFAQLRTMRSGSLVDKSMAFELSGVLSNEYLRVSYEERLQIVRERMDSFRQARIWSMVDLLPWGPDDLDPLLVVIDLSDEMRSALCQLRSDMFDHGVRGAYIPDPLLRLPLARISSFPASEERLRLLSIDGPAPAEFVQEDQLCAREMANLSRVRFTPSTLTLDAPFLEDGYLWAGFRADEALNRLAHNVALAVSGPLVCISHGDFSPRVALLQQVSGTLPEIPVPPVTMTVDRISLIRSRSDGFDRIYETLGSIEATREDE